MRQAYEINAAMVRVAPELSSEYAAYPLFREQWLSPAATGPKGEPCFVAAEKDDGPRMDYVYCKRGPSGPGYYSLLTKTSYKIQRFFVLFLPFHATTPTGGGFRGSQTDCVQSWRPKCSQRLYCSRTSRGYDGYD